MKLLFCPDCGDVQKMLATFRRCRCGAVEGRYINDEDVEVTGERVEVIGIDNHSLSGAMRMKTMRSGSLPLDAWLFPNSPQVRRLGRKR